MKRYGSRAEVWHGAARMTKGRLTKKNFIKNKHGRIVSKLKVKHSKNKNKNPLLNLGYQRKKGSKEFGPEANKNTNNTKNVNEANSTKRAKRAKRAKKKNFFSKVMNIIS